jgi:hypothetical protein
MTTQRFSLMTVAVVSLIAINAPIAAAQWNVARNDSSRTLVYGSYGLDPSFVATLGVARSVSSLGGTQFAADAGFGVAETDTKDFRGRIGARVPAIRLGALRLVGDGAVIVRGTSNAIYRSVGFGASTSATLGIYRPRWFAGAEAGFDKSVVFHITHSDWYKSYFYSEAKDGWYGPGGGTYRFGLTGGIVIRSAELMTRTGLLRTERFNDVTPPLYLSIGAGFRVN